MEQVRLGAYAASAGIPRFGLRTEAGRMYVFEDVAPQLADLDGDGAAEIVVVRSHLILGAQFAVYGDADDGVGLCVLTATPSIGTGFRSLAPLGAADLDGDGTVEIATVDRPHRVRMLRVWRYEGGALTPVAALKGVGDHRIGDVAVAGGIRDCGERPEIIVADACSR